MNEIVEKETVANLIEKTDENEIKKLVNLINLDNEKRAALRSIVLNDTMDTLTNAVSERVKNETLIMDNDELLGYFRAVDGSLQKHTKYLSDTTLESPTVNISQTNINVTRQVDPELEKFDRDSREKITNVVMELLNNAKKEAENIIDVDLEENKVE